MWEFRHKVRTLVSAALARRTPERRRPSERSTDWLPPVFGPDDWSTGLVSDRGANWYFDRR